MANMNSKLKFARPGERPSNFDLPRPAGPVMGPPRRRKSRYKPAADGALKTPLHPSPLFKLRRMASSPQKPY